MSTFKIELGCEVQDKVTLFRGIVTARTEYLYGCRRYGVQARASDNKPSETIYFDEDALEVIVMAEPHVMRETGGDGPVPQRQPDPQR